MTASPACLSRQVGDFLPPAGGLPFLSPADLAAVVPDGGRARLVTRLTLPPLYPAGGLPSLSPPYPALSLLSCPLSPRPPSPAGKGETKSLFRRGLRPRHPCTEPLAALTEPVSAVTRRGRTRLVAGSTCRRYTQRGACLLCRLLPPAFSLLSCPLSPRPALAERSSPAGRGEPKSLFRRGASPPAPLR